MSRNRTRARGGNRDISQYGIFGIPTDIDTGLGGGVDDDNDDDLEAELAALAGGGGGPPKRPQRKAAPAKNLDALIAASMKDIPDDEELSGDDDDPDLLSELHEIAGGEESAPVAASPPPQPPHRTPPQSQPSPPAAPTDTVSLLETRLKMYEAAETNAKAIGENSRARRYNRAIKTIKDLIKQAKAGKPIPEDEIPPEVGTNIHKPKEVPPSDEGGVAAPTRPAPAIPETAPTSQPPPPVENEPAAPSITSENAELLQMLNQRRNEYKAAALKAKKQDDKVTAINYIKVAKQFESVIAAVENGQPVDLSRMPGPPQEPTANIQENETQKEDAQVAPPPPEKEVIEGEATPDVAAGSVEEALLQRIEFYKKQVDAASADGNTSKARRMGRVLKQFEDALKMHKKGKPIPVDELPVTPGFAPIPVPQPVKVEPTPAPTPAQPKPSSAESPGSSRVSGNHKATAHLEQQVALLLAKQKQFKLAALNAKKKGELNQAKEFLRTAKGFDPLIEAAKGGLPVDLSSLPVSPTAKSQLDEDYHVVMAEECNEDDSGTFDLLSRLETQLTKQLKMCLTTRDHHKALGDVAGMNRFERLALNVTKDLDVVRLAQKTPGVAIPKFHYENKDFSIVKSFTELGDNDLELSVVRGVNYLCNNPKEIDTYVKFEFPFPQEEPYRDRTSTVKDTNNPEYNQTFTIPIQRSSRACQRVFKRHGVKFEVYSKGGFFRSDNLLGSVTVKLQPLETQCELHDSFDIMEGRKKVGGKLEIRMRVRHPLLTKEMEQVHERWLVLDS